MTFQQLGDYEVSQNGTKITVTGELNETEWPEFSSRETDRTGYYVTLVLEGTGYVGKTTPSGDWKASAVADCADGWCVAVRSGQKSFTFQAFASEEDAEGKTGGVAYTVDLSGVTYN